MSEDAPVLDPAESAAENALARRILLVVLVALLLSVGLVVAFGLPALGIIGLVATALCFAVMLGFMMNG